MIIPEEPDLPLFEYVGKKNRHPIVMGGCPPKAWNGEWIEISDETYERIIAEIRAD